eukprot:CAMPEP_0202920984 /NCGR_PEP_ID=MMETSP1392-20130828/77139_1 /ASSEMBLY_ACC=CAM_ASM_000868 /TAXON_ID=225041 /ORGANISM="Chlamydomonas chlamydogama, Strain SAG 11-48b" /LENGTH=790 /DNA_ID=CAMNT_0049614513 /DNA_START=176 /DNA_END=2548 /DNA_ORIENTATION=+
MATKVVREWYPPEGCPSNGTQQYQGITVYNSLVDEKVPFIPAAGAGSKQISWYTCGPTVYDSAHLGHARNYVGFDIVRRVLEDYFGYNISFVMNVTDVDDKIILRARRNYLLNQHRTSGKSVSEVHAFAIQAAQASHAKQEGKVADAKKLVEDAEQEIKSGGEEGSSKGAVKKLEALKGALKQEEHKLTQIASVLSGLQAQQAPADAEALYKTAGDYMAESLDKELGSTVTDASIFRAHAAKYEAEFLQDMDALGCRRPDVMTRVSEYIPEVVEFVDRIVKNGMAYASNGSVYFDTSKFRECGHTYGKLNPWAVGSATLACEGESNFETSEKRNATDFALWKASKPGEPFWDSPWGQGRPGWHIECSAMASSILGSKIDIHSGGDDLRFPHHDNELAQSEAHYHHDGCRQWVNYFLHSGWLEIEGLKMSKSLKNFITIREALNVFTPRQLRLMFVLQPWNRPMMYGENARAEMRSREAQLKNFFQNIEVATRGIDETQASARWSPDEVELHQKLTGAQKQVHDSLCDNINTAAAMDALSDLIKAVNVYLAKKEADKNPAAPVQAMLLRKAAAFVTRILTAFGVVDTPVDRPGLSDASGSSGDSKGASYLDAFSAFRDEVRSLARAKAEPKEILAACDRVRDTTLVDLGVRLEDKPDGKAVWKLDDPAVLKAEQEERARQAAEAAAKKLQTQLQLKVKEKEKFDKLLSLPSVEASLSDKYSRFDPATGEPTHDKEGKELEGKAKDKAKKDLEKARKVLEPLTKKQAEDPAFMDKLAAEIEAINGQLAKLGV